MINQLMNKNMNNYDFNDVSDDQYEILSCKSKKRYETYWQAKFAADEQMQYHKNVKLGIYECQFCNGWHLTSQ